MVYEEIVVDENSEIGKIMREMDKKKAEIENKQALNLMMIIAIIIAASYYLLHISIS
jgi:hypothetical protein